MRAVNQPTWMLVDEFVAAFERARAADATARLADYLPPADDPLHVAVLSELVRVDLEDAWQKGESRRLETYRERFPQLFDDPARLAEAAFEEYRLRHQAGEHVPVSEYRSRFGVELPAIDWPKAAGRSSARCTAPRDDDRSTPDDQCACADFPAVGSQFLDVALLCELGRGAFGRVYLAVQGDLANRYVVLKITARQLGEPQTLARLQHTNIVPIYSFHHSHGLQAVCMPYFGATTLADVLHELSGRDALPHSGKVLVETVWRRHSVTHFSSDKRHMAPDQQADSAAPAPAAADAASLRLLQDLNFVDAVLWIGIRLADGLVHAHERGVVHRDLKPANILLSDEGQPMLLDFNLSADAHLVNSETDPMIGGTLPYMAPEHLAALEHGAPHNDARSDVYSLGVVLYELLAGRLPFCAPRAPWREAIAEMIADRRRPPTRLRPGNRAISPAVESILARCLEADAANRYQSAEELREDLTRQLEHRPLRYAAEPSWQERASKWHRRHKQLTSFTALACAAALVIALMAVGLAARGSRLERLAATASLEQFLNDAKSVQFELNQPDLNAQQTAAGLKRCSAALDRYQIAQSPDWLSSPAVQLLEIEDRQRLKDGSVELLLIWARTLIQRANAAGDSTSARSDLVLASQLNLAAQACFSTGVYPRTLVLQQAEIDERLEGPSPRVDALRHKAERLPLSEPRDLFLAATDHLGKRQISEAIDLLEQAILAEPQHALAWLALGHCRLQQGDFSRASACYGTCIALSPAAHWAYFDRGLAHLGERNYQRAKLDFSRAIALHGGQAEAWVNRGLAELELREAAAAIADFTRALELKTSSTRVYFMRAKARELAGDRVGAAADRALALSQQPTDETSWISRGVARLAIDPQAALADFEQALVLNPQSRAALEDKAHVLAERLGRTDEAVEALDLVIALYPEYAAAYAGRGVLLARLGQFDSARGDSRKALLRDTSPPTVYRAACVYALASAENANDNEDQRESFRLLSSALRGGFGLDVVNVDPDLAPLRQHPDFRHLVEAARTLIRPSTRETR